MVNPHYQHFFDGYAALDDNLTWGEEVWKAAQRETWAKVFQIVSDNPQLATREFIQLLEAARDEAGCGPVVD